MDTPYIIITPSLLGLLLKNRRGSKALAKLLPYFIKGNFRLAATYEELRLLLGYKTRAGAYQSMKKLQSLGVVVKVGNEFELNLGTLWLKDN